MPTTPLAGFPDVYDAFFGGGRDGALVASIDALGVEVRGGMRSALGGSATMFADLGTTFAAEADRAASMGSVARMRGLAADAAVLSERVFGPEADRLRAGAESRRPDPLATAFEQAVTSGGFALVGGAIPAYVGEMRRFWATKRPPVDRPTSPHILARHGRLGGVRVPRMTVRASGRTPTGSSPRWSQRGCTTRSARRTSAAAASSSGWAARRCAGSRARPGAGPFAPPEVSVDPEDQIVAQMGLLLSQVRYSRIALEHIERATTRYAGIALSIPGGGGAAALGAPPLIDGALKVYVVNINDLTAGPGIGDMLAGVIGGAGRFLGGFAGGLAGGALSGVPFP